MKKMAKKSKYQRLVKSTGFGLLNASAFSMRNVVSSNVSSIGHSLAHKRMRIGYKDGSYYQYWNVSESTYQSILGAGSIGHAVYTYLKRPKFKYQKE